MAHADLPRGVAGRARDPEAHGRRTGRAVFGLLLTLYGITAGGSLTSTDSVVTFELTRQMVAHGSLALPADMLGREADRGRDGRYYSPFGLAQAVFNIPFYVAAVTLERAGVRAGREDSLAKAFVALAVHRGSGCPSALRLCLAADSIVLCRRRFALVVRSQARSGPSKFGFNAPLAAGSNLGICFAWRVDREGGCRIGVCRRVRQARAAHALRARAAPPSSDAPRRRRSVRLHARLRRWPV